MEIQNANDHPFKVAIVRDADMFANDHPLKVYVEGGGGGGEARVVTELPETGESGYIYLVLKEETSEGDIYDEWIWALQADGTTYGWEHLGTTNEVTIKLYDTEGNNTDGAATQRLVTSLKGQAKILTSADYNANSSNWSDTNPANFNCIALWLLEPGVYTTTKDENLSVRYYKSGNLLAGFNTFIIGNERDGYCPAIILRHKINAGAENASYYQIKKDGSRTVALQLIDSYSMVTNLTNTSAYKPLAANQGKVLKDLIDSLVIKNAGAPTTATVGTVGQLLEDTTNGKLYQCTAVSGSTYTWAELGGGGGGNIVELNYSDYNPTGASPAQAPSLGEWLFSKNLQYGQVVRIVNDTSVAWMGINLGTREGIESTFELEENKPGIALYIMGLASKQQNRTALDVLVFNDRSGNVIELWRWVKEGQTVTLQERQQILTTKNIQGLGGYASSTGVLSAASGAALQTIVNAATNISGVGKVDVEPMVTGTTLVFNQTLDPWDFEWMGTMTLDSSTPYDFSQASVGDTAWVYVRDTSGVPLAYTPEYPSDSTYRITDTAGNTIDVSGWRYDHNETQLDTKASCQPGEFLCLKKFADAWRFVNSINNTTYLPRSLNAPVITLTDTDPGEGQPLAENQFIGVY